MENLTTVLWELAAPWARDTGTRVTLLTVRPKFGDSQDKCRHIQDVLCLVSNILSQHSIRPVENLVKAKLMPYLPFGADRSIRSRSAEALTWMRGILSPSQRSATVSAQKNLIEILT